MKQHVDAIVRDALTSAIKGGAVRIDEPPAWEVAPPAHPAFGDLACNVGMALARGLGESPHRIAAAVIDHVDDPHGWLADVAIGGPGFVNFRFSPAFWRAMLGEAVAAGVRYGCSGVGRGRRAAVSLAASEPPGDARAARGAAAAGAIGRLLGDTGWDVKAGAAPAPAASDLEIVVVSARASSGGVRPAGIPRRVVDIGPVRLARDGVPERVPPSAAAIAAEIGADAAGFALLLGRLDREIELDLVRARAASTDNPLFLVQLAHARLAQWLHRRDGGGGDPPADLTVLGEDDGGVLRAVAEWPDAVAVAARGLEPDRIARYAVSAAESIHRWLNRRPKPAPARLVLAGCLRQVTARALATCGAEAPERM